MFDLDAAIDEWIHEATRASPDLAPHVTEIADHLGMVSLSLMADGVAGPDAFSQAVDGLGEAAALAGEFRKQTSVIGRLRNLADPAVEPSRDDYMAVSIAIVALSMVWAAVMFVFDNSVTWAIPAWAVTTYLPLTVLSARGALFNEGTSACDRVPWRFDITRQRRTKR